MTTKDSVTAWRADLGWYLGIVAASGLAFGLGQGPMAGLLAAATMLAFTLLLAFGRRRIDAITVLLAAVFVGAGVVSSWRG